MRTLLTLAVLVASAPAGARAQSVLFFERDADAGLANALRVELSVSGLLLDRVPAAMAEPPARLELARERGATCALWIEEANGATAVVAVSSRTGVLRRAPLSADAASPRVRALVGASLIDELLEPIAEDAFLLAPPAAEVPAYVPGPSRAYRLIGDLEETDAAARPLLSFYGQLLTGPTARVWGSGADAPWSIRLDAGWADRGDNRLALAAQVSLHAFDASMASTVLFGLAAGSRVGLGPVALHVGAYVLGGSGSVPEDDGNEPLTTALAGGQLGLGIPLGAALDLILRADAGLLLRQRSDPNLVLTLCLGLEWHG